MSDIINKLDYKIALLGEQVCKLEKLGKPTLKKERDILRLIAYKVYILDPNEGDERAMKTIIDNAIKTINNV